MTFVEKLLMKSAKFDELVKVVTPFKNGVQRNCGSLGRLDFPVKPGNDEKCLLVTHCWTAGFYPNQEGHET